MAARFIQLMLFNSAEFLFFLPLVLLAYHLFPTRFRKLLLLAASYWFYAAWDARFLGLLFVSTGVDYGCARGMTGADARRKRGLLIVSLGVNLGILGTFKYFDFFVDSLRAALHAAGLAALDSVALELILPLGISFYTFQTLAYTIDVYRGSIPACTRLLDYAIFVAYFPQLVAGPIERASRLLPQLAEYRRPSLEMVRGGLTLILYGFFKKVVISDALVSRYVEQAFAEPGDQTGAFLLLGVCLFSLQIYADFSGYSDIARGVSRLLGIELMINFNQPYLSRSISEFWRRWHISLSSWLRDYLYIPLGGNRHGRLRTYRNLMITMLLGGLWHGASWNFVIWGGIHGGLLAGHRLLLRDRRVDPEGRPKGPLDWANAAAGCLLTNLAVIAAWIFFRASDLPTALTYLAGLGDLFSSAASLLLGLIVLALYFGSILLLDLAPFLAGRHEVTESLPAWARTLVYASLLVSIWTAWPASTAPFIYFQF